MPKQQQPFFFESDFRSAFLANMAERLKDAISEEGAAMLKARSLSTPTTDVSLMLFLKENDLPSIAEAAQALDFSHQRVASRVVFLEKLDLVNRIQDTQDQRCKRIQLTDQGKKECIAVEEVCRKASLAIDHLFSEINDDLMDKLLLTVNALKKLSISERISRLEADAH